MYIKEEMLEYILKNLDFNYCPANKAEIKIKMSLSNFIKVHTCED